MMEVNQVQSDKYFNVKNKKNSSKKNVKKKKEKLKNNYYTRMKIIIKTKLMINKHNVT